MEAPMMHRSFRHPPTALTTQIKPAPAGVEMVLKIGTALLISFAAMLVLVHAEVYFAQSPIMFLISNCLD
jgi:hypothetical protein